MKSTSGMGQKSERGRFIAWAVLISLVFTLGTAQAESESGGLSAEQVTALEAAVVAQPDGGAELLAAIESILTGVSANESAAMVAQIVAVVEAAGGHSGAFATTAEAVSAFVAQTVVLGANATTVAEIEAAMEESAASSAWAIETAPASYAKANAETASVGFKVVVPLTTPPCMINSAGECSIP